MDTFNKLKEVVSEAIGSVSESATSKWIKPYQQMYNKMTKKKGKVVDVWAEIGRFGGAGIVVEVKEGSDTVYYVPVMFQEADDDITASVEDTDKGVGFIEFVDSAGFDSDPSDWEPYDSVPDF